MTKRTRSIARGDMAKASRYGLKNARELWRDPARRREIAFNYRQNEVGLSSNGRVSNRPVQPLPIVIHAMRWSFHSTVGRNGAVRWHAHQVNAGLAAFLGHGVPGEATPSAARSATPARWRRP